MYLPPDLILEKQLSDHYLSIQFSSIDKLIQKSLFVAWSWIENGRGRMGLQISSKMGQSREPDYAAKWPDSTQHPITPMIYSTFDKFRNFVVQISPLQQRISRFFLLQDWALLSPNVVITYCHGIKKVSIIANHVRWGWKKIGGIRNR